jgi:hypothetical protein
MHNLGDTFVMNVAMPVGEIIDSVEFDVKCIDLDIKDVECPKCEHVLDYHDICDAIPDTDDLFGGIIDDTVDKYEYEMATVELPVGEMLESLSKDLTLGRTDIQRFIDILKSHHNY